MVELCEEHLATFTIPGPPQGYYSAPGRGRAMMASKRGRQYKQWCDLVRASMMSAGYNIPSVMANGRDRQLMVYVEPKFRDGRHCDPPNVGKGVIDALCYGIGDKHVGQWTPPPLYCSEPYTSVVVCRVW